MFNEVREFLASHLEIPEENIQFETPLTDLGVDSMTLLTAIYDFETTFDVNIPDRKLEELSTVGDLVNELISQKGAGAKA